VAQVIKTIGMLFAVDRICPHRRRDSPMLKVISVQPLSWRSTITQHRLQRRHGTDCRHPCCTAGHVYLDTVSR
jgi:hypothetical protein